MIVSPLFIGGLGNRLYQLAAATYFANKVGATLSLVDLSDDVKRASYRELGCFKVEDLLENGGHPTKYKLSDVFDLRVGSTDQKRIYLVLNIEDKLPDQGGLWSSGICCIHTHGNFMFADIAENTLSRGLFPRWSLTFQPPPIPMTSYVVHLRVYDRYDNIIDPSYLKNQRIEGLLASISCIPTHEKSLTIFTNGSPEMVPEGIRAMAKYIYGSEVDVYEALRAASGRDVKVLVMSCSTLSGWMAFLGSHEQVYCPGEYIDIHGQRSYSNRWIFY